MSCVFGVLSVNVVGRRFALTVLLGLRLQSPGTAGRGSVGRRSSVPGRALRTPQPGCRCESVRYARGARGRLADVRSAPLGTPVCICDWSPDRHKPNSTSTAPYLAPPSRPSGRRSWPAPTSLTRPGPPPSMANDYCAIAIDPDQLVCWRIELRGVLVPRLEGAFG